MDRSCGRCGERLGWEARADARWCSTRCRVAAHRARKRIPDALTSRPRWVRHRDKVPLTVDGRAASVVDPSTWSTFDAAATSKVGDGFGLVLDGDGLACVDLDHAIIDGKLTPWARHVLDTIGPTYVEVSPSGAGLHAWGTVTDYSFWKSAAHGRRIEFYTTRRYLTVTGVRWECAPDRLANLDGLTERLMQ